MKQKVQLVDRLQALYDKYEDIEIARAVIQAVEQRDELQKTRWDRIRDWTIIVCIVAYAARVAWDAFQ